MIAWTSYTGVSTSEVSHMVLLMKRNLRLRRELEDMISCRVKQSLLSHSTNSPWVENGINTSADASCCPWNLQRSLASLSPSSSMEHTVRALPAPRTTLSTVILERQVKVNGWEEFRLRGLRLTISSTELYGISSGTILNKPEKQQVSLVSYAAGLAALTRILSTAQTYLCGW